ncbi:MAG: RES domain-containing protein [bacterium]|nr:RES domain-containing protein [bacterium]
MIQRWPLGLAVECWRQRYAVFLYTSLEESGAKAEIASFLAGLNPLPTKKLLLTVLSISLRKVITLGHQELDYLGVDLSRYKERDYSYTRVIGSAVGFLGFDGLIAPSARWDCNNLMIYTENHSINEKLEVIESREFDWLEWARSNRII